EAVEDPSRRFSPAHSRRCSAAFITTAATLSPTRLLNDTSLPTSRKNNSASRITKRDFRRLVKCCFTRHRRIISPPRPDRTMTSASSPKSRSVAKLSAEEREKVKSNQSKKPRKKLLRIFKKATNPGLKMK